MKFTYSNYYFSKSRWCYDHLGNNVEQPLSVLQEFCTKLHLWSLFEIQIVVVKIMWSSLYSRIVKFHSTIVNSSSWWWPSNPLILLLLLLLLLLLFFFIYLFIFCLVRISHRNHIICVQFIFYYNFFFSFGNMVVPTINSIRPLHNLTN